MAVDKLNEPLSLLPLRPLTSMQIDGEDDDDVVQGMDRLSQLPHHIFQHFLSFLSQKDAAKTSLLSTSCRYLWSARPNVEFCEYDFKIKGEKFADLVDRTLQGYHDQNLRIERFCVNVHSSSSSSLEKWVPKVCALGVKTLKLETRSSYFDLPPEVFESQSLLNLYLQHCRWTPINMESVGERKILFKHLRTLHLYFVVIEDVEFEKIMLSCPFIEHVVLDRCIGLTTINLVNNHNFNLNYFEFAGYYGGGEGVNVQIYTPSITTIIIKSCCNWCYRHLYYPNLKSLRLCNVQISKESFDSFSSNFPRLEELELNSCFGFKEFELSSPSIKHLTVANMDELTKAAIDAPKIVMFEYETDFSVASISFATTSNEWKADVRMCPTVYLDFNASSWFLKISELLSGLSHSEIKLFLAPCNGSGFIHIRARLVPDINYESGFHNYKPVAVEGLKLNLAGLYTASSFPHFINVLFRVCRPRKIGSQYWYPDAQTGYKEENNQVIKSLCKILRMGKDECRDDQEMCCWQQDLEEVILQVWDENEATGEDGVWRPVQETNWLEFCDALPLEAYELYKNHKLRFQLRWC